MSRRVLRKQRDPLEYIERLLERTTLSTQRVSHKHIIDIGDNALTRAHSAGNSEREAMIESLVKSSEKRHTLELIAALERQSEELGEDHREQILRIKYYYENQAKKVSEERDKAETERVRLLTKQLQEDMRSALEMQRQQMELEREQAVKNALAAQLKQLRNEFALEKELAVADALAKAREKFKIKEAEAIARTKAECERIAAEEAARVASLHAAEVNRLNDKIIALQKLYSDEHQQRVLVETDFMELQEDYKRFMIYTGGKYHADYLMIPRDYGWDICRPQTSHVLKEHACQNGIKSTSISQSLKSRSCTTFRTG